MLSPNNFTIMSRDFGPCNCRGEASGSKILTSKSVFTATPWAHNKMSLSAKEIQKRSSARRKRTGSFKSPPSSFVISMYLH